MTHAERAKQYFLQGYNCTQAVVLAFCDDLDIDRETALKISSSFGGGMARLREVCGAVSGMFMIAGLMKGYSDPQNTASKTEHYKRIQALAKKYRDANGSIVCRDLLGLTTKDADSPVPEARTAEYYKKRPCADLVAMAAQIVEEMIAEENKNKS